MADPSGGLARRAGYASQYEFQQKQPVLHVDAGNYFKPEGPGSDLINHLMGESLRDFPMQILNLTAGDLGYWSEHLARSEDLRTDFVSTNLLPLAEGAPAPLPWAVVTLAAAETGLPGPLRIGFWGLATPQRIRPNSGYRALDPVEAIGRDKDAVLGASDLQVLLTDLGPAEIAAVLGAHPEIDIVIRGERRFVIEKAQQIGPTIIVTAVERGRSLGQLQLVLRPDSTLASSRLELVEMGSAVPSDPALAAKEAELLGKLP